MESIIKIKNLSFAYDDKKIFNQLSLDIELGSWTTILGQNGCGKTTLARILLGLIPTKDYIVVNKLLLEKTNIREIRRELSLIFSDPERQFVSETVWDDITSTLENYGYSFDQIKDKMTKIKELYGDDDILLKSVQELTNSQKQFLGIVSTLVQNLKVIILDEAFTMMDDDVKKKAVDLLKRYQKNDNLTVINITHNTDECLYGNRVVIIGDGCVVVDDKTNKVLEKIEIFEKYNIEPSFIADLSNRLKAYNLIDKIYLNEEELIDALWK